MEQKIRGINATTTQMLCPSYTASEGESVIGQCSEVGDIKMFARPLSLTEGARSVLAQRDAASSMRFTGKCFEAKCGHWDDGCDLGRRLANSVRTEDSVLRLCPIRVSCRWFSENGANACQACRFVTHSGFVSRETLGNQSEK